MGRWVGTMLELILKKASVGLDWICVTMHTDHRQADASIEQKFLTVRGNLIFSTRFCSIDFMD